MPVVKRGVLSYLFWLQGTIKLIYETLLGGIPIPALQNRNSTLVKRSLYASCKITFNFYCFFFKRTANNCAFLASKKSSRMSSFPHWRYRWRVLKSFYRTSVKILSQTPSHSNHVSRKPPFPCPKASPAVREKGSRDENGSFPCTSRRGGDIPVHCLCETSVIIVHSICSLL